MSNKLYAIQRPDGTIIQAEPGVTEGRAWLYASVHEPDSPLFVINRAESLGYRCVEVEVVVKEVKP